MLRNQLENQLANGCVLILLKSLYELGAVGDADFIASLKTVVVELVLAAGDWCQVRRVGDDPLASSMTSHLHAPLVDECVDVMQR